MTYINIGDQREIVLDFKKYLRASLILRLESFLNSKVTFYEFPTKQLLKSFEIEVQQNWNRSVYKPNTNCVILIPKIMIDTESCVVLGIRIDGKGLEIRNDILEQLSKGIAVNLSKAFNQGARFSLPLMGDDLIKLFISYYLARGNYNWSIIYHAIEYFISLRTTSFEGEEFTTGMIITKSGHDYAKGVTIKRPGLLMPLFSDYQKNLLNDNIDRRLWYLVDGFHSYYLVDQHLKLKDVYLSNTINDNNTFYDYVTSMTMYKTLMGSDILFRIESAKELSIITSDGIIFRYHENHWTYRDMSSLSSLLQENTKIEEQVILHIIFYVINCSKRGISSIMCISSSIEDVKKSDIILNKQRLTTKPLDINDVNNSAIVMRCLSSDGASVIDHNGILHYHGCIVNLNSSDITGLHGTGETAARLLSQLGVVFKVSQDGSIKLFLKGYKDYIFV